MLATVSFLTILFYNEAKNDQKQYGVIIDE